MKRLILSALAFSMVAATSLQGQAAPMISASAIAPAATHGNYTQVDWKKNDRHHDRRAVTKRKVVKKKVVVRKSKWHRGQRYSDWRRHKPVRDYSRHGLRRPGHGQEWIRVGNDYLLISIASGLIGGMIASH